MGKFIEFFTSGVAEEKLMKFDLLRSLFFQAIPIVFTILVTIYTIFTSSKSLTIGLKVIIVIICFLVFIVSLYNCWNECIKKDFIEALYKSRQIENKYNKLTTQINQLSNEIHTTTTWAVALLRLSKTIIDFINSENIHNTDELNLLIKNKVINWLYDNLNTTLNKGEYITIAIYIHDNQTDKLVDYISKKSDIMPKGKRGRSWNINSESQIAHTFRSKKYHVFYDIQKFLPGLLLDEKREFDEEFYRASITYPLCFYDKESTIRGVFCITSNMPGAFSLEKDNNKNDDMNKLYSTKQNLIFTICTLIELLLNCAFPNSNNELIEQINQTQINN